MGRTNRRRFLKTLGAAGAGAVLPRWARAAAARRPNIVFIITDQQHAGIMSAAGNPWLKTPAMDRLAASGMRFERAYAANPVCLPARFSFFTGHMPSEVRIGKNEDGRRGAPPRFPHQAMGHVFRRAGYETVYGGKVHLPKGMGVREIGFRPIGVGARGRLADACAAFLKGRHDKPFLLVASFINPHDICYMAINDYARANGRPPASNRDSQTLEALIREPRQRLKEFVEEHAPPLPANFDPPELEPECITERYLKRRRFRLYVRRHWSPEMWRLHRWAYCRLTEMVDAHVGKVLDAVREAGLAHNTLIVFTSDHGDHDSAHRLEHKSILYEEAARIPFIMSHKGVIPAGAVDEEHLVSNGLDLLPTLCDWAGVEPPAGLLGASLRPIARGLDVRSWREYVAAESHSGRMLRTERFKYVVYVSGAHREQLFDLDSDPGEMRNLAEDDAFRLQLDRHRRLLREWMRQVGDPDAGRYAAGG